uniref:Trypsin-like cysteine/serine peptidase domain-containing protein n=1 Tax=Tanacetum cinerariifolium TaxID=118510 RepID=A0A6L2MWB5_TANCI|nr:trypsin-like cysteine/serine peptidase domain-containing protein [Tanacetum cinerariifolium]
MGVLSESWCFCNGGGKSERTKGSVYVNKGSAMAKISSSNGGLFCGTGFLIHRNLLLTTHGVLPSVASVEAAVIEVQNGVGASLFPHRFFITSSVLDLTIVGLDLDGDSNVSIQQPPYLKACSKSSLDLGSIVYLLGHAEKNELTVGEGKVVIATDNLIKVCADGVTWSPGSAGFDAHGNLSFMVCDPMKLATSPNTKSNTTSSSSTSWKKDLPMQFGIPMPVICDWLNQHWEGSLDDLVNKPKLPLIRLMSTGQRSEQSCTSFSMRQVFKTTELGSEPNPEPENDPTTPSSAYRTSKFKDQPGPGSSPVTNSCQGETPSRDQGIPTPEIYERPRVRSDHVRPGASEGETTMYSAETAESRNYPSPKEGRFGLQPVGRSQSCVNYNRWGPIQASSVARGRSLEKQRSYMQSRKVYSQGATSHRSNEYCSPTVSSIMKKRNNLEQQWLNRSRRPTAVHSSPKWAF